MLNRLNIVFCLFFALLLCSCEKKQPPKFTPQPDARKIKIGVIGPMSGPSKNQGKDGLKGIKAARELQPALPNGDWIELVVEDDQDDPELAVKALKKLVEVDKVTGVLILSSSNAVLAVNKEADKYETPVLALIASHADIAEGTKYVNQLCFDNEFQGKIAALYARDELLDSKVAVCVDNKNAYSKSLADIFTKKFKDTGGEITVTFPMDSETDHLVDTLKYMQKQKTELLYMPISSKDFIAISKALNAIDWHPIRMGSDGLLSDMLTKYPDQLDLLEGVVGIDFYAADVPVTDLGEDLMAAYRKNNQEQGNTYIVAGMEGHVVLINAITRSGDSDDKVEISKELRRTVDFEGFMTKISIRPNGKVQRPLFVNTIKNGNLKFLVKVY